VGERVDPTNTSGYVERPKGAPVRPGLLTVRQPLSPRASFVAGTLAFALPFLVWCAISYLPFLWHPLVLVHQPGDTRVPGTYAYLAEGQLVEREVFAARNAELARAGAKLATG
jgi:NitT/TauT family transport system permease protein